MPDERYRPDQPGRARLEHFHRYSSCIDAVRDKVVLDLACGEGYGTRLLAQSAASVTGIDIDFDTLARARTACGVGGARFVAGTVHRLPFASASFDMVVCFEAIEHVVDQPGLLSEARRVLKPDGALIVSTPERDLHRERQTESNPYHVSELSRKEFEALLQAHFPSIEWYGQGTSGASMLLPEFRARTLEWVHGSTIDTRLSVVAGVAGAHRPEFLIAVCGQARLPMLRWGSLADGAYSIADEERLLERRVAFLNLRLDEARGTLDALHHEVAVRDARIAALESRLAGMDEAIRKREAEFEGQWRALNGFLETKERALQRAVEAVDAAHREIHRLHAEVASRDARLAGQAVAAAPPPAAQPQAVADPAERASLREARLEAELAGALERARTGEERFAELSAALEAASVDGERLQEERTRMAARIEELEAARSAGSGRIHELESELATTIGDSHALRVAADDLGERLQELRIRLSAADFLNRGQAQEIEVMSRGASAYRRAVQEARWLQALRSVEEREAKQQAARAEAEIGRLGALVARLRASRSWRLTEPLRSLRRWVRVRSVEMTRALAEAEARECAPGQHVSSGLHALAIPQPARGRFDYPHPVRASNPLICLYDTSAGGAALWRELEAGAGRARMPTAPDGSVLRHEVAAPDMLRQSITMAMRAGVSGFAFVLPGHARGGRGLEVLGQWLAMRESDFSACIAFDGAIPLPDDSGDWAVLADCVADPRYLRMGGEPIVMLLHDADDVEDAAFRLRAFLARCGLPRCRLVAMSVPNTTRRPSSSIDAEFECPPRTLGECPAPAREADAGTLVWEAMVECGRAGMALGTDVWRGVCVGPGSRYEQADREPGGARVRLGYQNWLVEALLDAASRGVETPVIVNAWNAWRDGLCLHPDQRDGAAALAATSIAVLRAGWIREASAPCAPGVPAVIIHAYYPDMFADMLLRLDRIPMPLRLYVSCPPEREAAIRAILGRTPHAWQLESMPNRGRDMLPFLSWLPHVLSADHGLVLKLHTKRSPHLAEGAAWGRSLIDALVRPAAFDAAARTLAAGTGIGLLCPERHLHAIGVPDARIGDELAAASAMLGVDPAGMGSLRFPAGGMFFARATALRPLLLPGFRGEDFELERGQVEGTLAHAVERLVAVSAASVRLDSAELPPS